MMIPDDTIEAIILETLRPIQTDSQDVEVKSAQKGLPKDTVETLSAFANGSGGILIFGLSEKDGFSPVPGFEAGVIQDALADACSNKLVPALRPRISFEEFEGGTILVAFVEELAPRNKPCYVGTRGMYEGSYIRTGDGDRKLTHYEIDRLLEERVQPRHDSMVVEEASLDDFNPMAVSSLLQRERFLHPNVFGALSDEEVLVSLRAASKGLDGDLHPTLAGLLALATHPQKYFPRINISFASYPSTSKAAVSDTGIRFLDSAEIIGSIPVMIADALAVVVKNMRTVSVVEGAFRSDIPEYPPIAIREAIANALMHRDLSPESWGTQVQINMYPDRLEILSPGGLYGNVTIETLGELGVSSTRNEFLSRLLASTSYFSPLEGAQYVVENKGTGYLVIKAQLAAANLAPPVPRDRPSVFSLTLFNGSPLNPPSALASAKSANGKNTREVILEMARSQDSISAKEVGQVVEKSRGTVLRYLNKLVSEGIIEPTADGSNRNRRYRLKR